MNLTPKESFLILKILNYFDDGFGLPNKWNGERTQCKDYLKALEKKNRKRWHQAFTFQIAVVVFFFALSLFWGSHVSSVACALFMDIANSYYLQENIAFRTQAHWNTRIFSVNKKLNVNLQRCISSLHDKKYDIWKYIMHLLIEAPQWANQCGNFHCSRLRLSQSVGQKSLNI